MGARRLLVTAVAAVAVALTMSGCVVFSVQPSASQSQVLGSVRATISVCATQSSSPPSGACNRDDRSDASDSNDVQVLLAFRLPAGAGSPGSFTSTRTGPSNSGPQLTFTKSPSYTSELQRVDPAPAGYEWQGYISQQVTYSHSGGEQNFDATIDFGLPPGANGAPFAGPFIWRPIVGFREPASGPGDASEPVHCGSTIYDFYVPSGSQNYGGYCADDPSSAQLHSMFVLPTHDARVLPGLPSTAPAGTTAVVPFAFLFAGPSTPAASFTFGATTGVGGTAATPSPGTLVPASDSTSIVKVAVPVPVGTAPGTYAVNLTASLADGETRAGTAQLKVTPPCTVPKLAGKSRSRAKKALEAAHCKLGKVKTKKAAKGKRGKVVGQKPAKGTVLPGGSSVSITLGK